MDPFLVLLHSVSTGLVSDELTQLKFLWPGLLGQKFSPRRSWEADLRAAFDIICDNVGKDWRRLARYLKVTDAKIDAIEEKYPRNLTEQVRESLRVWKSSRREDAAVSHLVRALRACQLNLVADLIEEEQQARGLENESKSSRGGGGGTTMSLRSWDSDRPALGTPW
eukprot:XP_022260832.1 LOW QUALITY PROTEIN: FAS-associated death domain protein [Canis lupus familiaris]